MTAPPGTARLAQHRRHQKRRDQQVRTETLIRYTHTLLEAAGVTKSASWVSRSVRAYEQHGLGRCRFGEWLTDRLDLTSHQRNRAEVAYLLGYADPTGESAARNVDRERGGRDG